MLTTATLETIEVRLPIDILKNIRAEAMRRGTDANAVIVELASEKFTPAENVPNAGMTFREIFAPVHEEIRQKGITEEEIEDFIDTQLAAHRREVNGV